jgi:hypothetical protein
MRKTKKLKMKDLHDSHTLVCVGNCKDLFILNQERESGSVL